MTAWLPSWQKNTGKSYFNYFLVSFLPPNTRKKQIVIDLFECGDERRALGRLPSKMRRPHFLFFLIAAGALLAALFSLPNSFASNLSISNVSMTSQDSANDTVKVQFDISWDNSWRNATNYDAVWVTLRFTASTDATTFFSPAALSASGTTPSGFSAGSGTGLEIIVPSDLTGAFLQRSSAGYGSVSTTSVQLVWNYAAYGNSDVTSARIKVVGMEMVYIPTGSFQAGAGNTGPAGSFYYDDTGNPYTISSEAGFNLGLGSTGMTSVAGMATDDDFGDIAKTTLTVASGYPKGYQAFYVMKHEISQGAYTGFLNDMRRNIQVAGRVASGIGSDTIPNYFVMSGESKLDNSYRNTITAPSTGNGISPTMINFSAARPDRAANYLTWMDLTAFCDWSSLRPMSDLEFEKAARGSVSSVAGEFAWGSTTITAGVTLSSSAEDGTATITTSFANANYSMQSAVFTGGDASQGPLRVGIFATSDSTRIKAGASYYGVMDLSGNVLEQVATIGNTKGRLYRGGHGDGALSCWADNDVDCFISKGVADKNDWPGYETFQGGVVNGKGSGARGGSWNTGSERLRVSDRYDARTEQGSRTNEGGGRCVRTAP